MNMSEFSPPYIFNGLYTREERERIEASNRATIAQIFKDREERERQRLWRESDLRRQEEQLERLLRNGHSGW